MIGHAIGYQRRITGNTGGLDNMIKVSAAHRLEYAAFLSVRWMLGRLSLPQSSAVSAFFWRIIAPQVRRHKRAERNLALALPELSSRERDVILNRMWDNLGRTAAEALRLNEIADNPDSIELDFSSEALAIMRSEPPAIFVSLHYGNWEVTALAAERFNKPLLGIYKKIRNPLVDRDVTKSRARFYKAGFVSKHPDAIRTITRAIKSGNSIAVMADLRESDGDLVPFFGIQSPSTTFPAMMARLYDLPMVAIRATRTSPGRFLIEAETIPLAQTADRKADILENTARIQSHLERWIKDDPALWMWGHRRWGKEWFSP
jgi:Kdo2-lipid IVA lauroyltransferase/acyltransferase